MLSDAWLLTDLDGTLISTPHKAHGEYLSLEKSPCFHVVKQWLLNGGNICIVTTADRRVFHQVYAPLQSILNNDDDGNNNDNNNNRGTRRRCGELLLSLYTGAVLYRCTATSVQVVREYASATHRATSDAVRLAKLHGSQMRNVCETEVRTDGTTSRVTSTACVQGTCFSQGVCHTLVTKVEDIFLDLVRRAVQGDRGVHEAFHGMSARYKEMWRLLLDFLETQCRRCGPQSASEAAEWKWNHMRERRELLGDLGIIRIERPDVETMSIEALLAEKSTNNNNNNNNFKQHEARVLQLIGDESEATRTFVRKMMQLLGTKSHYTRNGQFNNKGKNEGDKYKNEDDEEDEEDVAQLIVLGTPHALFCSLFEPHMPLFSRFGVTVLPQPNSVVFSKMGISKSTVIRYLIGERDATYHHNNHNSHGSQGKKKRKNNGTTTNSNKESGRAPRLHGIVNINKVLALGDNPQTADYELTVFPELPFVSVEMAEQRRRRHARIRDAGGSQTTPQCGPLMDDRRIKHILYVGSEEDGTAVFLAELMRRLHVPPAAAAAVGGEKAEGGNESCGETQPSSAGKISFMSCVVQAALESYKKVGGASSHL